MDHLDNLAIMNYLQGHGLIGGVRHFKKSRGMGLSGGVITEATQKGAQAYRDFIKYEVEQLGKTRAQARAEWKLSKGQPQKLVPVEAEFLDRIKKIQDEAQYIKDKSDYMKAISFVNPADMIVKNKKPSFKLKRKKLFSRSNIPVKDRRTSPSPNIHDVEKVHKMLLPQLRKYAKSFGIALSYTKETGKRKQLNKKELLKKLGLKKYI